MTSPSTSTTEERILDAVDQVIADNGASGVTLRRVGDVAGLSHTAAAHYYRDKPGLFTAYITRAWNRVADRIDVAIENPDPLGALLGVATAYAEFAQAEASAFSVMSRLELTNVDAPELWAARERGFFALAGLIERAQQTGWAESRNVLDLVATTWSCVHGFVDLWVGGPLWAPYDGHELVPTLQRVMGDLLDALR